MNVREVALGAWLWLAVSCAVRLTHPLWLCLAAEEFANRFAPVLGVEAAQTVLAILVAAFIVLVIVGATALFQLISSGRAERR